MINGPNRQTRYAGFIPAGLLAVYVLIRLIGS